MKEEMRGAMTRLSLYVECNSVVDIWDIGPRLDRSAVRAPLSLVSWRSRC